MSQPGGHDSMREKLARRWDVMAADNESTTRAAAERRRPSFVMTAFRGIVPPGDTPAGCASPGNRAEMGSAMLGRRAGGWVRWFFSGIWLVYLIAPVSELFGKGHGPLWIAGGVTLTAVFCVIYITILATWESYPRRAHIGLAVIVALSVIACLVYGGDWTPMWIYVSAATGFVFPGRRRALIAVTVVGACYALLCWIDHVSATQLVVELLPVVLIGWAMVGFRLQLVLMFELRQARGTVAKLAANEERLRLARDMHDLTGQSLSLITLKAELAAKRLSRLPQSTELDAVLSEISDIGRVSRQTLQDIREAVSGYRRPTLAVEIITARTSLEAAGIHLEDDPALMVRSGTFNPEAEAALAWCLREAATNVIRHSGARNCRIRLTEHAGEISLEVSDDGRGFGAPDAGAAPHTTAGGTGLHGMSERLSAVGGRFSVSPAGRDGRGFRLTATVPAAPAQEPVPAQEPAPAQRPRSGPVDANVPS
jgi:two-component system, NarL family, sensor histidine kinase DesK